LVKRRFLTTSLKDYLSLMSMEQDVLIIRCELDGLVGELGVKVVQAKLSGDVGLERREHLLLFHLKHTHPGG
jgi:hypothetical protein